MKQTEIVHLLVELGASDLADVPWDGPWGRWPLATINGEGHRNG